MRNRLCARLNPAGTLLFFASYYTYRLMCYYCSQFLSLCGKLVTGDGLTSCAMLVPFEQQQLQQATMGLTFFISVLFSPGRRRAKTINQMLIRATSATSQDVERTETAE